MRTINDLKNLNIDKSWSLFLDRDGVINKRLMADYVKNLEEFEFIDGAVEAINKFSQIFGRIFVITNQRGIAVDIMTEEDVNNVHRYMVSEINKAGGKIDKIYFCPHERDVNCGCRKPDPGMAMQAQQDFPEVNFIRSIMVGDTSPDIQFGRNAGMYTIKVTTKESDVFSVSSLAELARLL